MWHEVHTSCKSWLIVPSGDFFLPRVTAIAETLIYLVYHFAEQFSHPILLSLWWLSLHSFCFTWDTLTNPEDLPRFPRVCDLSSGPLSVGRNPCLVLTDFSLDSWFLLDFGLWGALLLSCQFSYALCRWHFKRDLQGTYSIILLERQVPLSVVWITNLITLSTFFCKFQSHNLSLSVNCAYPGGRNSFFPCTSLFSQEILFNLCY